MPPEYTANCPEKNIFELPDWKVQELIGKGDKMFKL